MVAANYQQFDIYLVNLEPTIGREMKKIRPCVIVSPNSMNSIGTVVIAPMTGTSRFSMKWRVKTIINQKEGEIAIDQMKAVDIRRLIKKLDALPKHKQLELSDKLVEMFSL